MAKCSKQEKGAAANEWACVAEATATSKVCREACPVKGDDHIADSDDKSADSMEGSNADGAKQAVEEDEEAIVEDIPEN